MGFVAGFVVPFVSALTGAADAGAIGPKWAAVISAWDNGAPWLLGGEMGFKPYTPFTFVTVVLVTGLTAVPPGGMSNFGLVGVDVSNPPS